MEEKENKGRPIWYYMVLALTQNEEGSYLGEVFFSDVEEEANEWFDSKDNLGCWSLLMMSISPKLKDLLECTEKTEKLLYVVIEHKELCIFLRSNERILESLKNN